ncbi:MAG TPA: SDR family oxidoreductase [Rhabdochlamydiaceae bacterium]|nr:SDR family oxidoreductase [Rhabdochlamydiaceae bacterium]
MKSVIIGGSSGMGLAIAKMLHAHGHEIVIASRSKDKLERACKTIGKAEGHVLDITKEKEIEQFFSKIAPFDHLVTTAADFVTGPFLTMKTEEARHFFDSKFWGQYCAAKYAAPHIRKEGSIILFGGGAGQRPSLGLSAASAINAAIEGLARALALELGPLRVNAIAPGTIVTPVWDSVPDKEKLFKESAEELPVKRIGQPEDIAQAVLYLINCPFATGSVVYIDGGDRLI